METKTELKTFEIDFMCPNCDAGRMRPTGKTLMTNPPKYPHECSYCGHNETFIGKTYPYISYELL